MWLPVLPRITGAGEFVSILPWSGEGDIWGIRVFFRKMRKATIHPRQWKLFWPSITSIAARRHLIIVGEKIQREALQTLLAEQSGRKVVINCNPIGDRRVWLDMATENARLALEQMLSRQASQEERLQALQQALDMPGLGRIECFDISHTLGEATIASCVVYDNFSMRNSEYRRYNINGIVPGDDYAAMRDVLVTALS